MEGALSARRAAAAAVIGVVLAGAGCREVVLYDDPPSGGTTAPITWERTAGPSGESILALRTDQSGVLWAGTQSGRLYRTVTDIASGTLSRSETLHYTEPIDMYLQEPRF